MLHGCLIHAAGQCLTRLRWPANAHEWGIAAIYPGESVRCTHRVQHRNCFPNSGLRSSQCRGTLPPGALDPITQPFGGEDMRDMPIIHIAQTLRIMVSVRIYPLH